MSTEKKEPAIKPHRKRLFDIMFNICMRTMDEEDRIKRAQLKANQQKQGENAS